ncbi:MAG: hydroxymethylbilane synthase [Lachnospiraceae bacterium]|nr:hydroxymethylbilane synthase [Lachnospiraceae bacterium]
MKYVIGTRGSRLALAQAEQVRERLAGAYPEEEFEIRIVRTKGDQITDKPLDQIGDKGLFVGEIEKMLLAGEIQIGVHSMKDMPPFPAEGLALTRAWKREDPRDVLILREKNSLEQLPPGAVIGTGSRRRQYQLKRLRTDLRVVNIRGNVDTRLRKMEEEGLDGIVLAAAGLHRLGLQGRITQYLEVQEMIPAPAQGILALEIRQNDTKLAAMLDALSDAETAKEADAERGFLQEIGGDCHVPVGALCRKTGDGTYKLHAMFGDSEGKRQAYAAVKGTDPRELARRAAAQIRGQMAGKVLLVGAGPGDPGLITVKGLEAVRQADCIVYDRLASPELLKEARPECECIYVGKEDRHHTMKQEEINRLLVQKSMQYATTVRLKGGDPYVFGRGGEEGLFLRESGVPFEVIPGISSCIAGPALAGIPVTHRGLAGGFHVVTARSRRDELADIDFAAMARGKETCVFMMGLSMVREIADRLMEAGMPSGTGAAVISQAATPGQRVCVSDLAHIAAQTEREKLPSPAVIVVGDVVGLRDRLQSAENRPLRGRRYLVALPGGNSAAPSGEKSAALRQLLEEQGAVVDEVRTGEIVYTGKMLTEKQLREADWLIFTSRNGVEAFWSGLIGDGAGACALAGVGSGGESAQTERPDIRSLAGCRIAAVGEKTAQALRRHGLCADLIPDAWHSDALAEMLAERLKGTEKVWYVKAANADRHLREKLEKICLFQELEIYENREAALDLAGLSAPEEYDGVFFTCASSVRRLCGAMQAERDTIGREWRWKKVFSIGPKTTAQLAEAEAANVLEARQSTYEGLVELCLASEGV